VANTRARVTGELALTFVVFPTAPTFPPPPVGIATRQTTPKIRAHFQCVAALEKHGTQVA
jgi:hypothetical protein